MASGINELLGDLWKTVKVVDRDQALAIIGNRLKFRSVLVRTNADSDQSDIVNSVIIKVRNLKNYELQQTYFGEETSVMITAIIIKYCNRSSS